MMATHPLLSMRNPVKEKLASGETALGLFLLSGSSMIAEVCSTLPIDWLMVDAEASPIGKPDILHIFQALTGTPVSPMIRVSSLDKHLIEHALDIGAHAVLVPKVDTAEQANQAAAYSHFPPIGDRGVNPVRVSGYFSNIAEYFRTANNLNLCMVQIESFLALQNIRQIAAVDGVHVLFIGAGDLAMSLGQPGIVTGDKMDAARKEVLEAASTFRKIPGIFAYSIELAHQYAAEGFRFIAIGNEIKSLRQSIQNDVESFTSSLSMRSVTPSDCS